MITGTTASGTYYLFNKKDQEVPIIFVHGVGLTHEIWQPQLEFFNYHSNIAYDILGHGRSPLEEGEISCLLYTSPSPRDGTSSRMPSSA